MNSYEQIMTMRDFLGEQVPAHWTDRFLLTCLNQVQEKITQKIAKAPGGWLVTSEDVTPVASVVTLPTDCAKPVYMEVKSNGAPISFNVEVGERRVSRRSDIYNTYTIQSSMLEAYREFNQIVVNRDSYTDECTLWYQFKVPDLHVGLASAGGTTSLTLSANDGPYGDMGFGAKAIADYYNSAKIAVVSGTGSGTITTISDYTAARVATTAAGTFGDDSVYGTISRLPEQCHHLMWLEAAMIALSKPASMMEKEVFMFLKDRWMEAQAEFIEWISTPHIGSKRTRITEMD
jgi:hypothetical protein